MTRIPVIDIFAGPGGLGEGFSALTTRQKSRIFEIKLSIENNIYAHQTLELRSFFRQFDTGRVPEEYYQHLRTELKRDELFRLFPTQAAAAQKTAWLAKLGEESSDSIDKKIRESLAGAKQWVLIGGPPCQAYSIIGRARRGGIKDDDDRVYLYREYYRILAVHSPPVFVLENVKGLLSAEFQKRKIMDEMLADLSDPATSYRMLKGNGTTKLSCPGYRIYSLVKRGEEELDGTIKFTADDCIIEAEKFGIPQSRHRLILLGIRKDLDFEPTLLKEKHQKVNVSRVLKTLPRVRAGLSEIEDSRDAWKATLEALLSNGMLYDCDRKVKSRIKKTIEGLQLPEHDRGGEFVDQISSVSYSPRWYLDSRIQGTCNHSTRIHMTTDFYRYMFAACFAKVKKASPKLSDFPEELLPDHESVGEDVSESDFADRFRVQVWNEPARTVTSHISKDGHYYIHPDPTQCRSLTVREAARLQTFPDNYYFCGPRTAQYIQVGNAVPPLLAKQIANVVLKILAGSPGRKKPVQ